MTNVIPFPGNGFVALGETSRGFAARGFLYEFTEEELESLCRWYSAMKYAFPDLEAVMTVCRRTRVSAVGLYGPAGRPPNCLISKHEHEGRACLLWATDQDRPRVISSIGEITDRQITAIDPPRNETSWLDPSGWLSVFHNRMAGPVLHGA